MIRDACLNKGGALAQLDDLCFGHVVRHCDPPSLANLAATCRTLRDRVEHQDRPTCDALRNHIGARSLENLKDFALPELKQKWRQQRLASGPLTCLQAHQVKKEPLRPHTGIVNRIRFSPNGRFVAVAGEGLYIYCMTTWQRCELKGAFSPIENFDTTRNAPDIRITQYAFDTAFSADSVHLASIHHEGIAIWQHKEGSPPQFVFTRMLYQQEPPPGPMPFFASLAVSDDGRHLVARMRHQSVYVGAWRNWAGDTPEVAMDLDFVEVPGPGCGRLSFSADCSHFGLFKGDDFLFGWDTSACKRTSTPFRARVNHLQCAPDLAWQLRSKSLIDTNTNAKVKLYHRDLFLSALHPSRTWVIGCSPFDDIVFVPLGATYEEVMSSWPVPILRRTDNENLTHPLS